MQQGLHREQAGLQQWVSAQGRRRDTSAGHTLFRGGKALQQACAQQPQGAEGAAAKLPAGVRCGGMLEAP